MQATSWTQELLFLLIACGFVFNIHKKLVLEYSILTSDLRQVRK
jgi:hypothetical protein